MHDPVEIAQLAFRKEEHYREVVRECGVQARPGVLPWLQALFDAGIPNGIGSSMARLNIDLSFGLIGCAKFFGTIVSAEDVTRGKPPPDIFPTVAARLGVSPEKSVVFEDALFGLEAAYRAGMKCIGVATTHPAEVLATHADRVIQRLGRLDVQKLGDWIAEAR